MKNRSIVSFALLAVTMMGASAEQAIAKSKNYPDIYPFKPMTVESIYKDVELISEDKDFIKNFNEIIKNNLSKAKAKRKPWTSSYWPLAKGTIADPYENSTLVYYSDFAQTHLFQWKTTKKSFDKRKKKVLNNIDELSEYELSQLAPSEKYDLLLGDKSFDLTTRIMNNMYDYGKNNYFWDLTKITTSGTDTIQLAENYAAWGWVDSKGVPYGTVEGALRNDEVLQRRNEVIRGIKLFDSGLYPDLVSAVEAETDRAMEESGNYVIASRKVKNIASWEGICNGWSTAAGVIPRPTKAVSFKLPSGKMLKFYPDDIKGLASLYWFNSFIQHNLNKRNNEEINGTNSSGGTLGVGLRCNLSDADTDEYGRLYDSKDDPRSFDRKARCVGVHPAKWHLALVNIIGKQGRSFVVERKVKDPVDNHPMYKYDMKYFNPNTGKSSKDPIKNIVYINKRDQFKKYRNEKAVYVVGVKTTMNYLNYVMPERKEVNAEKDDKTINKTMLYDLELDADYNIVGGQWRAVKTGKPRRVRSQGRRTRKLEKLNHNQPDFFWTVTKSWKETQYFANDSSLKDSKWVDAQVAPPKAWLKTAKNYHSFEVIGSTYYGNGENCLVKNPETGHQMKAWCEVKTNTPQPLSNVINKLIELSSGVKYEDF